MAMRSVAAAVALGWLGSAGVAKSPDAPTIPETEFKVLPAHAQEFFQNDPTSLPTAFAPVTEIAPSIGLFGAVGGCGLDLAWAKQQARGWAEVLPSEARPYRNVAGGFHSFGKSWASSEPVVSRLMIDYQKWGLAREVYAMAETFRRDRNWTEAERWYAGVCKLWPRSPYAALAAKHKETVALLRILNEAGEEQSEEPPLAGPEKLSVMPREVRR